MFRSLSPSSSGDGGNDLGSMPYGYDALRTAASGTDPGTDEQCLTDGRRQPYGHEVLRWIEIILAGFVDNAHVAVVRGGRVWKNLVDLSHLQIDRKSTRLNSSHLV